MRSAYWRGYDDGYAGLSADPPKGPLDRDDYRLGYAQGAWEKAGAAAMAHRYREV